MKINYDKRIFGLDIMRAIAITLVVLSHSLWILPRTKNVITDGLSLAGVLGVEIFFVLSGFLIGRIIYNIYVRDDFSFKKVGYFWIRRWFRTLPNYYLILCFNVILALLMGTNLPENLWHYFLFLQSFAWEMPTFFGESWSLSIEEFAYIIGPFLLYVVLFLNLKIDRSNLFAIITLLIVAVFLLTKIFYYYSNQEGGMVFWNVNLKAITIYRIDAIYYGVFAAYISIIRPIGWKKSRLISCIIGSVIFIGINVLIPTKQIFIESYPFFWNVLYLPLNSIAIAFCLPLLASIKSGPKMVVRSVTFISLISYSIYLLHYSVVLKLMKYFFSSDNVSPLGLSIYVLVYLVLTCVISFMVYRFYEKPLTDLRDLPWIRDRYSKD